MGMHSKHPGVAAYLKNNCFCVRLKIDGNETRRSLETSDATTAETLAQTQSCSARRLTKKVLFAAKDLDERMFLVNANPFALNSRNL